MEKQEQVVITIFNIPKSTFFHSNNWVQVDIKMVETEHSAYSTCWQSKD